ncbi:MAG: hypothetical protein AAGF72_11615 [Pseudomonadota bacterium]
MTTSRWLALAFWTTMGVGMVVDAQAGASGNETGALLIAVASALLMFGWYLADSNEHNIDRTIWLNIAVVAIGIIALPYYRFRYFGARRGAVFLGWAIAAFVGTAILATLFVAIVYGFSDA